MEQPSGRVSHPYQAGGSGLRRSALGHGIMARTDDPEAVVEPLPVILAAQLFGDDASDKLMIGPEINGPVHFNLHWPGGLQIPYKGSPAQEQLTVRRACSSVRRKIAVFPRRVAIAMAVISDMYNVLYKSPQSPDRHDKTLQHAGRKFRRLLS